MVHFTTRMFRDKFDDIGATVEQRLRDGRVYFERLSFYGGERWVERNYDRTTGVKYEERHYDELRRAVRTLIYDRASGELEREIVYHKPPPPTPLY